MALLATLLAPLSSAGAQTAPAVPAAPTITSATAGDGQVTLTWDAGADNGSTVIRWEYEQSAPETNVWVPIPGSGRNTDRYTVTGLSNGGALGTDGTTRTAYQFRVRAVNRVGNGEESEASEAAIPSTVPSAPAGLSGKAGNSEVVLTWRAATATDATVRNSANGFSPIVSYEYRQRTGGGAYSPWSIIIGSGATTATHTVRGLTNGVPYQFEVRARNVRGVGAAAETPPVTIASEPGRPRSLAAVPGNEQVALSWTASSDGGSPITSWQFRLQTAADGGSLTTTFNDEAWVTIPGSGADTTSYTVASLRNNMIYRFQVRAVNARGLGSPATSAVVNPGEPPGAPTNLMGVASENSVTLSWDAPDSTPTDNTDEGDIANGGSPIIRYEYSQKTGDGDYGEWMPVPATSIANAALNTSGDKSHTVSGLTAGTAYLFRVRAVNATGAGRHAGFTDDIPVYPGTKPLAPANLSARPVYDAASGMAQVALSWASGGDGGSPITKWQYKHGTSLSALADSTTWVDICDNTMGASPACASMTSVALPRPGQTPGSLNPGDVALDTALKNGLASAADDPDDDEHHFVIRAVNARGDGFQSGTDSARFAATVPSAPSDVYIQTTARGTTPGTASVTLWWTQSVLGGSAFRTYEYAQKTGDGSWGPWTSAQSTGVADTTEQITGLTAGTVYTFRVRAVNAVVGAGASTESPEIAPGAPGSPGAGTAGTAPVLNAVAGTTRVTVSLADASGGAVTTGNSTSARWEYSYKVGDGEYGSWAFSNNGASFTAPDDDPDTDGSQISGLENGVAHTFRVRALNGQLSSPVLEARPVTPGVAPPAPRGLSASAGDGQVTLSWTSGGSGGPAITRWEYCEYLTRTADQRAAGTSVTPSSDCGGDVATPAANLDADPANDAAGWRPVPRSGPDTTSHTIGTAASPLANGTEFTYLVRAANAIGSGARAQANPATPGNAPADPSRVIVEAGDGQVTITVDAPPATQRSAATGYQVRKRQGDGAYDAWESLGTSATGQQRPSAETSAVVSGLTNGVSYTFQVRAVNAYGPGSEITSDARTPVGTPVAAMLGADAGDGQVVLTWAPATSGGSDITKWQYRQSESGGGYSAWADIADSGPATAAHTVSGLSNGVSYTFQVRAVNQQGAGAPIASAPVTPGTAPPAPEVQAAPGNGQVDLSWTPGASGEPGSDDYAAPATSWQYRMAEGEWSDIADSGADTTSHSATGLENGVAYTFEVRGVNAFGSGAAGSAGPVTPASAPAAPEVTAERGSGTTTVSWTAAADGGSPITGWHIQVNGGEWVPVDGGAAAASNEVDTDDGAAYTFGVRAVNSAGEGPAGTATVAAGTAPEAPEVAAVGGDGEITVTWTPGDDGGSAVTGWHHRMRISVGDYGDWTQVSADTTSVTVSGLASGTGVLAYTFQVRAVNGVGEGAAGTSNEAMPVTEQPAGDDFYSGVVTGPGFCSNLSLGGARLFAHDSDADGIADVCSLPYTRREAIARQNAVDALVYQYADEYASLVNAACEVTPGDADCGGDTTDAPPAVPINSGGPFYSGIITGPSFCANRSLGGPTTYPHDSDGDGVADVCALPYTRREAIARQLAGDILAATYTADFRRELATACRGLTGADYGDNPAHLETDACA
ncbi:fibronectin type III domain-containing protein [Candidatus Poriferisocius sp.]|uniref:fibronectin type III domain-containing protein n=1 Tax=Candidatus Poriferisocius sp. TaxID=3101276 RepID=UPI003B026924